MYHFQSLFFSLRRSGGGHSLLPTLHFLLLTLLPLTATAQDTKVADQILLYQRVTGGWPKNIDMSVPLSDAEKAQVLAEKKRTDDSTIDNGATSKQLKYLAETYQLTREEKYRAAFLKGIQYLLSGQYPNGGWPQFWPNPKGYQVHITYNDDAIANILFLFQRIIAQEPPYQGDLTTDSLRQHLQESFDKGIDIILKTQIIVDGKPTVWCQQHDHITLQPAKARAYELPSFCSAESVPLVQLLMSLPHSSPEVKKAIDGAIEWFKSHQLPDGRWARFYDLKEGKPFFCDRDGIPRRSINEIGDERRYGYQWYNTRPNQILQKTKNL